MRRGRGRSHASVREHGKAGPLPAGRWALRLAWSGLVRSWTSGERARSAVEQAEALSIHIGARTA